MTSGKAAHGNREMSSPSVLRLQALWGLLFEQPKGTQTLGVISMQTTHKWRKQRLDWGS